LVILASKADAITRPHQALGWIPNVYTDTEDLRVSGQRIVYLTNSHVSHLELFISAAVSGLERRAILDSLPRIEALPLGLYEMKITGPAVDPDCRSEAYSVRFEERRVEDLRYPAAPIAFERVRIISETLDRVYSTTVSPWMRATSTPLSAALLERLHPMRMSRYAFAIAFNPWLAIVSGFAVATRSNRRPVEDDNPFRMVELAALGAVGDMITAGRQIRDLAVEVLFSALFGAAAPVLIGPATDGRTANCRNAEQSDDVGPCCRTTAHASWSTIEAGVSTDNPV
jgi:hypothetical protein